ncbi:MAG: acetylornithine deacetylase [Gammaproteobacteria bacterium]|nr:acetylornithine deacetylase [Gammaproteobacteria bacterium]
MASRKIPPLFDMIAKLIALPSVSSVSAEFDMGNDAVSHLLAGWCESFGCATEIMPIQTRPGHSNMLATLGKGAGGLVIAGHTDTVPYNENLWQHDPFKATEADNRLYGLGTTDMKAFLALALEAASRVNPRQLKKPLFLLATAGEESNMSGAKTLVDKRRPHADFAVIGEPTNMRPVRMHKGIMMENIRITGRSGHSSNPAFGNSALEGMHTVISALLDFRRELQENYTHPAFDVPVPTLNLGHIHGGDNPNRICGACELSIDLRPLPGMDINELREWLHQRINTRLEASGLSVDFEPLFDGIPAVETSASSPLVLAAEKLTGYTAEAVAFGTEAPYLQAMGMDVIVLGPGDVACAHQPDEFLQLDRIEPTVKQLEALIHQFCM